jgi:hypothetical protein
MANINGWGRGTWGQLTWGEPLPVTLTAPASGTSALGTVAVDAEANVVPTGQVGTTSAPQAGVNAQAIASVPGLAGSVGSLSVLVDGEANVNPTGQSATSAIGTATTVSNNNLSVTLNASVSALGSVSTDCESNVTLTGQELTSSLGVVLVWSRIDENQTPNYTSVTGTQTPSWVEVA